MFQAMQYHGGKLRLIDQRVLPCEELWLEFADLESVAAAIEKMVVRGAPAIGCAAAFALVLDAYVALAAEPEQTSQNYRRRFHEAIERLGRTRPTAVHLFYALDAMRKVVSDAPPFMPLTELRMILEQAAQALYDEDLATCRAIGENGADLARGRHLRVLTHCNTGALATAGYGTALGVIRSLHRRGLIDVVYVDETRPWLQGARLTAYELEAEKIPYRVIADAAAGYLMQQGYIDWVLVGADRIAANGDTANKIGTYSLAVNAKHHHVAFLVAAPLSTVDRQLLHGRQIPVEERAADEIRMLAGRQITPRDAMIWNPSFDVTPAELISGIITERGVLEAPYGAAIDGLFGQ